MRAQLIEADAEPVHAFLAATLHDFSHLPAYVSLSATYEGGRAVALLVEDGARALYLPLIIRPIGDSGLTDAASPYGYPGPLVQGERDPGFIRSALSAGLDALRQRGLVALFVRWNPILSPEPPHDVGTVVLHGSTVSIDLTLAAETTWRETRRNHRREINRAINRGLTARLDPDFARYDEFKRLYHETMERRSADAYYHFGDAYFDALRAALGKHLHLALVEDGARVAAAGLCIEADGVAQYHLMGSDAPDHHAEPTKLMVHFLTGWARGRGNKLLHLGGGLGGAEDSLFHFKAGFSPRRHPYHTLRAVLDAEAYGRLSRAVGRDPEELDGFFPAYRSE